MLNGLVGQLAALSLEQRFAPRLSISAAHRPCTPPSDCTAKPLPDQLAGLAHRVAQVVQESSDPDAIHASALIDLLYEPGVGKPLQRSISSLQMAAWLGNRPAAVLADLAADKRAERTQA